MQWQIDSMLLKFLNNIEYLYTIIIQFWKGQKHSLYSCHFPLSDTSKIFPTNLNAW